MGRAEVEVEDRLMVRNAVAQLAKLFEQLIEDCSLGSLSGGESLMQRWRPQDMLELAVGQLDPEAEREFGDHLARR